jgi:hypothetical protein
MAGNYETHDDMNNGKKMNEISQVLLIDVNLDIFSEVIATIPSNVSQCLKSQTVR